MAVNIKFLFQKIWPLLVFVGVLYSSCCILLWIFEAGNSPSIHTFWDVMWYGIVTLSTVGYGDIYPVTTGGRIAGSILVVFTLTTVGFMISVISNAVLETKEMEALGLNGTKFKNHIVICGWSPVSRVALQELLVTGQQIAVITEKQENLAAIRDLGVKKNLFVTFGDPTAPKILERANINTARVVLVTTDSDTKNLIAAINVKSMNPKARIIVSISREELKQTMTVAGVTYVASPFELSGRLAASAAFEPEVALFIDDITSAAEDEGDEGYDLQQFTVPKGSDVVNLTVQQFRALMEQKGGPLLLALATKTNDTPYKIQPHPTGNARIAEGTIVIVLGNETQNSVLCKILGVCQGR